MTSAQNQINRIAIPTESRDTLYVLNDISSVFIEIWNNATDVKKPKIIAVKSLAPYLKEEETTVTN